MPTPVIIVPYDPTWPRIYEEESRLIRGCARDAKTEFRNGIVDKSRKS